MNKNGFAPAGNQDNRECRTVRAYGTVVYLIITVGVCSQCDHTEQCEQCKTHVEMHIGTVWYAYGTVVGWSAYDTCVRYGGQVVNAK